MRAHHRLFDIGKADLTARFMRYGAPRIGRLRRHNTMVDQQAVESEPGFVSRLKNSLSIASRGARRLGALPENCHLLPSAAILEPQNRYARFNRCIRSLPFEGMPASLSSVLGHWLSVIGPHSSVLIPYGGRRWLGSTPGRRRPQIRGFRAGGLLAVASSTPATQLLSPAKTES